MTTAEERFEALFAATYGDVLAYTVRRCPSRQDAEDVVAETFAVAWRRISDVPQGPAARPWLFGTAHRVRLNQERAGRRQRSLAERMRVARLAGDPAPSDADVVRDALAELPATDREVLQLHVWEELSAEEIGSALDISTAAVWKRLQRARERLSRSLEEHAEDDPAPFVATTPPFGRETP